MLSNAFVKSKLHKLTIYMIMFSDFYVPRIITHPLLCWADSNSVLSALACSRSSRSVDKWLNWKMDSKKNRLVGRQLDRYLLEIHLSWLWINSGINRLIDS